MNGRVRVHNRQFVIDRTVHRIWPDWNAVDLVDGYFLSHCPKLRLRTFPRSIGNPCVLIGHAGTSINPANCSYLMDLMLRAEPSAQSAWAVQLACIRQCGTKLDDFAVNPILEGPWSRTIIRCRQAIGRATVESANFLGI